MDDNYDLVDTSETTATTAAITTTTATIQIRPKSILNNILTERPRKRSRPVWSSFGVLVLGMLGRCHGLQKDVVEFDYWTIWSPTKAPSESPMPSPAPSNLPSQLPSHSKIPTEIQTIPPTESFLPTPSPSISPTQSVHPSKQPTSSPTLLPTSSSPTPYPTEFPTRMPSNIITELPTNFPTTNWPTSFPTWQPSPFPSFMPMEPPQCVMETDSPSMPRVELSNTPSLRPSVSISIEPSIQPISSSTPSSPPLPITTLAPTSSIILVTTQPSRRNLRTVVPTSEVHSNDIPLTTFEVLLAFRNPINETDATSLIPNLQIVVRDYLLQELSQGTESDPKNGELSDLTLMAVFTGSSTRSISKPKQQQRLRHLQTDDLVVDVYSYNMNGTANVNTYGEQQNVDQEVLQRSLDSSVNQAFSGSEKEDTFSKYVRDHPDSGLLTKSVAAAAETQPLAPESRKKKKPTIVSIIFGFLLVGLAVLSLLFYAATFWKSYQKKAAQRKRERQGVNGTTPSTYTRPVNNGSSGKPTLKEPAIPSGVLAPSTVPPIVLNFSDDESSYEEQASDLISDKSNDRFAQELKLAASMDKRSWEEYRQKHNDLETQATKQSETTVSSNLEMQNLIQNDYGDDESNFDEGFELTETASALHINATEPRDRIYPSNLSSVSFPYGDEISPHNDPLDPQGVYSATQGSRRLDDPAGLRASQMEDDREEFTIQRISPMARNQNRDSYDDPALYLMNTLTANTGLLSPDAKETAKTSPPLSIASSAQSTQGSDLHVPPKSIPNDPLDSPNSSQDDNDDDENDRDISSQQLGSNSESNSLQSMLAIDIVKEVQRLTSFVKKYEMKREKEKLKEETKASGKSERSMDHSLILSNDILKDGDALIFDDESMSASSYSDWSADDDYGPKRIRGQKKPQEKVKKAINNQRLTITIDDEEEENSFSGSDNSRLGIHPFQVEQILAAQTDLEASRQRIVARSMELPPIPKPVSRPPVTNNRFQSTVLSPIPATPENNNLESPQNTNVRSPLDDISKNILDEYPKDSKKEVRGGTISPRISLRGSRLGGREEDAADKSLHSNLNKSNYRTIANKVLSKGFFVNEPKPRLKTLRKTEALLDTESELAPLQASPNNVNQQTKNNTDTHLEEETTVETKSVLETKPPPVRSANPGFHNIVSMFENKPAAAIFPPNENWQYNY